MGKDDQQNQHEPKLLVDDISGLNPWLNMDGITLEQAEKAILRFHMAKYQNKEKVARKLQVSTKGLYDKLYRHGLDHHINKHHQINSLKPKNHYKGGQDAGWNQQTTTQQQDHEGSTSVLPKQRSF